MANFQPGGRQYSQVHFNSILLPIKYSALSVGSSSRGAVAQGLMTQATCGSYPGGAAGTGVKGFQGCGAGGGGVGVNVFVGVGVDVAVGSDVGEGVGVGMSVGASAVMVVNF